MNYYQGNGMQRHDSEPLFGDDVYQLLRDDSLLLRTGSNNFAALIEPAEPPVSREQEQNDTGHFQQIPQQQQQQHMPLTQSTTSDQVLVVNNTENMFYQVSTSQQQQQSQGQQTSSGQREEQQQLEQIDIPWSTVDDNDAITLPTSHGQISQQEQFLLPMNNIYLPDTSTPPQRVPSLKPWPGRYEFAISIPTDNKDRNKWCFSELQKKLYMCPTVAVPVNVMLKEWVEASVIITPVFNDSRFRMEPVMRCYNCKSTQASEPELAEHIVQVEGEGCEYGIALERAIPPPPGETASTMLIKLMCLTSCVGGPNRRLFGLILTLKSNNTGEEIGKNPEVTADEMLEEEHASEEEEEGAAVSEEHNLSHSDIKGAMECAEKMKSFLSRDNDDDRYEVFQNRLVQAMEPYIKVYHDNINASHQQSITDFFTRNPPQPAQASDSDSEVDFEGFVREALTTVSDSDDDSPSNGDSPEGQ
ncbi:cellular tumor antigen p53-like 2 [Homarus americanus]|uniref:Cellular tumor antigen p53-like 2 n=1 Tax=Homarus americanus TaxID=6706 RepID=A0A8J5JRH5_HOMAM|nr:cellular tumor antigen p53-like 2 [Homarus americanus]